MNCRRATAFTLLEMIIASVLAAILIAADLTVMARLGRDRKLFATKVEATPSDGVRDLLAWDLGQADSIDDTQQHALVMIGSNGISRKTLLPDQRWTRVTYQIVRNGGHSELWRNQEYLDDPARPQRWREWVGDGVEQFSMHASDAAGAGLSVLQVDTSSGGFQVERRR